MSVEQVLNTFGNDVVKGAKRELSQQGKNASKALSNSLAYEVDVHKNSFTFTLYMEDYGEFIDKGVKGVGGTKADGTKWKLKKVTNNLYKYKDKRPPIIAFNGWTIRKGIAPRSKGGQFQKRRSLLFAIANSVYHTGLETTNFLSDPFNIFFKDLPNDVIEAYGLEVDDLLETSLNNI